MGAAGIALFQNILGLHLANPDGGVEAEAGAVANLPGPVGAPISRGPGVVSWILERLSDLPLVGFDLANLQQIQNPEAGTLFGIQSLDIAVFMLLALFAVGAALGMLWNRRNWLIISGVFWLAVASAVYDASHERRWIRQRRMAVAGLLGSATGGRARRTALVLLLYGPVRVRDAAACRGLRHLFLHPEASARVSGPLTCSSSTG